MRQVARNHREFSAPDHAHGDVDEHPACAWPLCFPITQPGRLASGLEYHRVHASTSLTGDCHE